MISRDTACEGGGSSMKWSISNPAGNLLRSAEHNGLCANDFFNEID